MGIVTPSTILLAISVIVDDTFKTWLRHHLTLSSRSHWLELRVGKSEYIYTVRLAINLWGLP